MTDKWHVANTMNKAYPFGVYDEDNHIICLVVAAGRNETEEEMAQRIADDHNKHPDNADHQPQD